MICATARTRHASGRVSSRHEARHEPRLRVCSGNTRQWHCKDKCTDLETSLDPFRYDQLCDVYAERELRARSARTESGGRRP